MWLFKRLFGGVGGRVLALILLMIGVTGAIVGAASYYIGRSSQEGSATLIIIGLMIAGLLIVVTAAVFFTHRISGSLVTLKTGAERLGLGELGYRIDIKGADELRSLAASFNRMAEAIQSSHDMMEQKVVESTWELKALNETITSLRRTLSPDEILHRALHLSMAFIEYEIGWCYLAGYDGLRLLYHLHSEDCRINMPEAISPGVGELGRMIEQGEAAFYGNTGTTKDNEPPSFIEEGAFIALPLRSPSRALGLICLASSETRLLPEDSKETLKTMAGETAIALENVLLYRELQEHVDELEKANRELLSLDEMKTNFISAVTHELKQPLALISGYTQTMYDYYDNLTFEEEMHCLRVVIERTHFLADLVEDLLDISMLEMGKIRPQYEEFDLSVLTRKVVAEHDARGRELKMTVDFPADFPAVVADARRMEQVLSNLLSNAVKFSQGRGEIRVCGRVGAGLVQVRVEDQGVGIEPSQLEKIFDRFHQADASPRRPYPGVGLGLFICRELIGAHRGRIWAENRPEGGSAFIFEIPLEQETGR